MNRDQVLQRTANVMMIISAIVLSTIVYQRYVLRPAGQVTVYKPGDRLVMPSVDISQARATLLLVLDSRCRFCTDSLPFYRRLVERLRHSAIKITVVGYEDAATLSEYLAQHHLSVQHVQSISPSILRTGTPALFLVDNRSRIIRVWKGKLSEKQEADVLTAIDGGNRASVGF
jgi:hypothetical protein